MADIEADVIIVGSGISGALLAAKLSYAGVKVAILEAGPKVDRGQAMQRFWDAPIRVLECPYPPSPQANHPISNDPDYWYRQIGPNKFKSTYLKVVGGTTWHWLGTCLRFVPNDFRLSTVYGRGVDWPVTYDDLEPFYSHAEDEVGVSGDSNETLGSPRSTGYPMPAIPQTFMDQAYARALVGTQFEVRATPQARNSAARDERPACCGSASCIPICPVQAKYDATTAAADLARLGLRGPALDDALRTQACRQLHLTSLIEQLPDPQNRVTLDPTDLDIYGVPLPRLAYSLGTYVEAGLAAARDAHAEIFGRLDATEIQHRDVAEGAGHIIGTARMGSDPTSSVVDRDLRSHDHPNLFILGSAVFPTSATANPTLTIAALSLRAADQVKATLTH
ncbi:MAG TPA: GMC family oxidoreductase [Rhizobiales bacterium]|jgi:choline dehydrogenase-like flavoprotein|nr:GMC family oxidoreductase [Hyphomicrobiales bacterium]HAN64103.1 GMC family oxidoreductase [Hyphomicrobiales bacterium]